MIQKEIKNTMVTNTTNESRGFTIDTDNAKAYQILADGIYRHKIAAVVRELMANCYDSHVASGKKDVPFRVKFPTSINPVVLPYKCVCRLRLVVASDAYLITLIFNFQHR